MHTETLNNFDLVTLVFLQPPVLQSLLVSDNGEHPDTKQTICKP